MRQKTRVYKQKHRDKYSTAQFAESRLSPRQVRFHAIDRSPVTLRQPGVTARDDGIGKHIATRQELIPFYRSGSLSIGDNRLMWIPKGSEILRLYAYLRPSPGTIPEMRFDLSGQQLHRCNQLEIAKGGSHFRTPEPRKSITD
jgi:hypothetical protein